MNILFKIASIVAILMLSGCGGGGGGEAIGNSAPVANSGSTQNVSTGSVVTLNGSGSSDADGHPLTYVWELTSRPPGSSAVLTGGSSATPTFTADYAGTYIATLKVNDGKVESLPSSVTIRATTTNPVPVASAGSAQNVVVGNLVSLNGSTSSDANGDPLSYSWTLSTRPFGSNASMSNATSATPSFVADMVGSYTATLVVSDGQSSSEPATVTITASAANAAPVAVAGGSQNVTAGSLVTLSGGSSSDANGDPLTYSWILTGKPQGSTAALNGPNTLTPTFVADVAGSYVASLTVNDGSLSSTPSTVTIIAATPLGGLLSSSTRLEAANSPYTLASDLLIPSGLTLSLAPGVALKGNGKNIQIAGTFSVEGTSSNRVILDGVTLVRASSVGTPACQFSIVGASVTGGNLFNTAGSWGPCSFVLTDSRLDGVSYIYLHYPTGPNKIERNVFNNCGGISYGLGSNNAGDGMAASLLIQNNSFSNWTGGYAVENWALYASGSATVKRNSFLTVGRTAVLLPDGYSSTSMDATENYWGTTDLAAIGGMIYDKSDSLLSNAIIPFTPILTVPDPATPQ